MKKFAKITIAVAASTLISFGAIAEGKGEPGTGPNPFVDCGIGAALFSNIGWAAVTSNVIWDVGTTAVTSATASPETCNGKSVEAAAFIYDTFDNLAEETAKGQGEHIDSLLNILEANADTRDAIIAEVRSGMATQVSSSAYDSLSQVEKASAYYNLVNKAVINS
ncbi:MAG: DUF3015 family protein [Oceanospirillaceae bacterium]